MLNLVGQVLHTFVSPKGKDREGSEYGGDDKVQILGDVHLPNGEIKKDLLTLKAHDSSLFDNFVGKKITIPVGVYSPSKGNIIYFIPKTAKPVLAGTNGLPHIS